MKSNFLTVRGMKYLSSNIIRKKREKLTNFEVLHPHVKSRLFDVKTESLQIAGKEHVLHRKFNIMVNSDEKSIESCN